MLFSCILGTYIQFMLSRPLIPTTLALQCEIIHQATLTQMDPALALAVAEVESHFDPMAMGTHHEIGVYQIRAPLHRDCPAFTENIRCGLRLLRSYEKICGGPGFAWVVCYNRGPKRGIRNYYKSNYFNRVTKAYNKWKEKLIWQKS